MKATYKIGLKNDWCHACGGRAEKYFFEVWLPQNAEHDNNSKENSRYVRICEDCIIFIETVLNNKAMEDTAKLNIRMD